MRGVVFAKPEVANPPDVTAQKTRRKCFKLGSYDARAACITGDGWELLE